MTSAPTIPPLTGTITVDAPIDHTFRTFTENFGSWWPAEYHIGQADMATAMLELRQGGRWYEQGIDGSECDWGRVLAWEPPHRLVMTWQINGHWQYDPDPAHASEIEVRFGADGPDQTTVTLAEIGNGLIQFPIQISNFETNNKSVQFEIRNLKLKLKLKSLR